ncbi:unnamed protein product, partial [Rotaria magnacalcarata]
KLRNNVAAVELCFLRLLTALYRYDKNTYCLQRPLRCRLRPFTGRFIRPGYSAYLDFISLDSRPFEIASGVGFKQFIQMIYNAGRLSLNSRSIEISDFLPHPTPVSTLL